MTSVILHLSNNGGNIKAAFSAYRNSEKAKKRFKELTQNMPQNNVYYQTGNNVLTYHSSRPIASLITVDSTKPILPYYVYTTRYGDFEISFNDTAQKFRNKTKECFTKYRRQKSFNLKNHRPNQDATVLFFDDHNQMVCTTGLHHLIMQ